MSLREEFGQLIVESYHVALGSPDPSTQNGAILIDADLKVLGKGCNNFPLGVSDVHWQDREAKYARVVHAEVAAILNAATQGWSTMDSILIAPWSACSNCAKHIAAAGVKTLIRHPFLDNGVDESSPWFKDVLIGDEILIEAGVDTIEVDVVPADLKLRRNGALWGPGASNQD